MQKNRRDRIYKIQLNIKQYKKLYFAIDEAD